MANPLDFAKQYGAVAKAAGDKLGVDPSILLGQWGLETGFGKSVVPGTNNLGNIKDFSGGGVAATDNMTGSNDNYQKFDTPQAFADHYTDLIQRKYPDAVGAGSDAVKFAKALKGGGYAEDPLYVNKIVNVTNTVRKQPGLLDMLAAAVFPAAQAGELPNPKKVSLPPDVLSSLKWEPISPAGDPGKKVDLPPDVLNSLKWEPIGTAAPTSDQQITASVPGRIMKGIKDPIDAGAQMLLHSVPGGVSGAVNDAAQYVNDLPVIGPITKALGMTPATAPQLDKSIADSEKTYQAARAATGSEGMDLARLTGNIVGTAPLAATPAPEAGLAARAATGALQGAGFGMTQPVLEGDYGTEKLKQAALGGALGGATAPVVGAISRVVSPNASTNKEVKLLLDEGVTPTPGQLLGGTAQKVEDKATSLPIVGDAIVSARERGVKEFNRAALNRALEPLGKNLNDIGRGGIKEVGNTISKAYDDLLPGLTFRADNAFAADLSKIQQMAQVLPDAQVSQLDKIIQNKIVGKLTPQGAADGLNYKQMESEIGRMAKTYLSSADADQRTLGTALAELQNSLRSTLTRSNPQAADELAKINEAYSIFTRIQRAAGGVGPESGVFTPAQLQSAVRASDSTMRKGRFAKGEAVLQDLSEAGKNVMGGKVPDSGTAGRLMNTGALASGFLNPAIPASLFGGALPYLPGANKVAASVIARRPDAAQDMARQIRSLPPGILALFGNLK